MSVHYLKNLVYVGFVHHLAANLIGRPGNAGDTGKTISNTITSLK